MYPQLLKNVKVEDKAAVIGNARVQAEKEWISAALGEDGRILLRERGTIVAQLSRQKSEIFIMN